MNPIAAYKNRLGIIRGELLATKAAVLPYVESSDTTNEERKALCTVARGVSTIAGILVRIIDSLPTGDPG